MKSSCIGYNETGAFSPVVISYLEQDANLKAYFNHPPSIEGFKKLISEKKPLSDRNLLVNTLKEQYSGITEKISAVTSNIELLLKDNTYTITTGHQLNIFTGPLYFIYKIVTAVKLAGDLKKALPEYNFVPVYWMATEDHDFEEINHTIIGGKKISWHQATGGATGRIDPKSLHHTIKEYQGVLGLSPNASKLASIIETAYQDHSNLADATRYLVNALFGDSGLVIIDADQKDLKQLFSPVIQRDILEQNSFREITKSSEELLKAGYPTQVHPREINFFYLLDGLRERIVLENNNYYVLNTELCFSKEELSREIESHPERFSPNVVLRPLYQEMVLPNLAYIGGGAEIVYWLQLKQYFDFYKVDFPILILRNSALFTDEDTETKLHNLDLTFSDLFKEIEKLKKEWVVNHTEHELSLSKEWAELQLTFEKIKSRSSEIDVTLRASAEAVSARLHKALLNLERKLVRAEKRNFSTALLQIEKIKNSLFPGGGLQERTENFGLYYVKYGDELIPELIRHFRPLDFKFTILY